MNNEIRVGVTLEPYALAPSRGYVSDAGLDLYSPIDTAIPVRGSEVIDTGVHLSIPEGYAGLLVSKSGLNIIDAVTSTGLIDSGFTGTIRVRLYNDRALVKKIDRGDKITQVMFVKVPKVTLILDDRAFRNNRGDNGYGSTDGK